MKKEDIKTESKINKKAISKTDSILSVKKTTKKATKKKPGQRGKAKPIGNPKEISYENKAKTAKSFIDTLDKDKKTIEKKTNKKGAGRPPVIDELTLRKLKTCFAVGMTDEEACYFCKVSTTAFYEYQKKNKELMEEKTMLKKLITLQAKFNYGRVIKEEESKAGETDIKWSDKWLRSHDPAFKNTIALEAPIELNFSEKSENLIKSLALGNYEETEE